MATVTYHGSPVDPEDIYRSGGFQGNRNPGFLKNIINTTAGVPNAVYSSNKADFTKGYGNRIPILTASNAAKIPSMSTLPTGGAVTGYEYLQSPAQASKGQRILADVMANKWPNSAKANFLKGQINNPTQSKVHLKNVNLNALDKVVHPNKYLNLMNMGNNPIIKNLMKVAKIPGLGLPLALLSEANIPKMIQDYQTTYNQMTGQPSPYTPTVQPTVQPTTTPTWTPPPTPTQRNVTKFSPTRSTVIKGGRGGRGNVGGNRMKGGTSKNYGVTGRRVTGGR